MSGGWWIVAGFSIALATAIALAFKPLRKMLRETEFARAQREFRLRREHLEAKFYELAAASGKPRWLRWVDCEFDDDVTYARDRQSGRLAAFVGITVSFEPVEGGLMEDVEAVGDLRAATAVFLLRRGVWSSDGRVMFNLNPAEAIAYYHQRLEKVGDLSRR